MNYNKEMIHAKEMSRNFYKPNERYTQIQSEIYADLLNTIPSFVQLSGRWWILAKKRFIDERVFFHGLHGTIAMPTI
jgi:hypothetical protein